MSTDYTPAAADRNMGAEPGSATRTARVVTSSAMTREEYYRRTANSTRPYGEPAIVAPRADSRVGTLSGVRR